MRETIRIISRAASLSALVLGLSIFPGTPCAEDGGPADAFSIDQIAEGVFVLRPVE